MKELMWAAVAWMFASSQNSNIEILTSKLMVLEGGTFGRCLGHEGGAFTNGVCALMNGIS